MIGAAATNKRGTIAQPFHRNDTAFSILLVDWRCMIGTVGSGERRSFEHR
jgi:hypothetical protein